MQKQTIQIQSKQDGLMLSVLCTVPDGECKGVVQLVHGMAEYKERYLPFMEVLAQEGYAAVIHDHRGHGASRRARTDRGYLYGAGAEGLLQDTRLITLYIQSKWPKKPVILFGHSMGSMVARCLLQRRDDPYAALVLSGCPGENAAAPFGILLARLLCLYKHGNYPSALLNAISFGGHAAKFRNEQKAYAWLNSSKEAVEAYEADPECGYLFTPDGFLGLYELMSQTYDTDAYYCGNPNMPILFLSGEDDPCYYTEKKFYRAAADLVQAGYEHVSCKRYPGMRHEILNEPGRDEVYRDILTFLEKIPTEE